MKEICDQCRIGHLQPIATPYLTLIDGQMMVVPDAPAYHCDMCGSVHYDDHFLIALQQLIDRFTSSRSTPSSYRRSVAEEEIHLPQTQRRSGA